MPAQNAVWNEEGCWAFIGISVSIEPILEVMVDMICMDDQNFLPWEFMVWCINPHIFPVHESEQFWEVLLSWGKLATGCTLEAATGNWRWPQGHRGVGMADCWAIGADQESFWGRSDVASNARGARNLPRCVAAVGGLGYSSSFGEDMFVVCCCWRLQLFATILLQRRHYLVAWLLFITIFCMLQ